MINQKDISFLISSHDQKCGEEWRVCRCTDALLLRQMTSEEIEDKDSNDLLDLAKKRHLYLMNVGVGVVFNSLRDLSDDAILTRIATLDKATQDEAFLRIRKKLTGLDAAIEALRAIKQGAWQARTLLYNRFDEAEKKLRQREDSKYEESHAAVMARKRAEERAKKTAKPKKERKKSSLENLLGDDLDGLLGSIDDAVDKAKK